MRHRFRKLPVGRTKRQDESESKLNYEFSKRMIAVHKKHGDCHEEDPDSGVVYVANIPHGFYEVQMYRYFTQFGRIKRLRLSRSKKSGRSKGFAFIEFEYAEVAKAAAETMNNYLFMRKMLKCEVVPKDKLHPETFRGCFNPLPKPTGRRESIKRNNAYLQADGIKVVKNLRRRAKQETKKEKLLAEMGIDFKIDAYSPEFLAVQEKLKQDNKVFELQQNWEEEDEKKSSGEEGSNDQEQSEELTQPVGPLPAIGKPEATPDRLTRGKGRKHPLKDTPKTADKKAKKTGKKPSQMEDIAATPKSKLSKSVKAKSTGKEAFAGRKLRSGKSRQSM